MQPDMNSVRKKWLPVVGLLIACLAVRGQEPEKSVEPQDETGWTPLIKALRHREKEKALELIRQGADVNAWTPMGSSTLSFSTELGDVDLVKKLLEAGADPKKCGDALLIASQYDHLDIVKLLLSKGADVNYQSQKLESKGLSAVFTSAANGKTDVLKYLLESGANTELLNKAGDTPLMETSKRPLPESVKLLIEHKANVNAKGPRGHTALIYAGYNGQVENIKLLLAAGAEPNATANDGENSRPYSALDLAEQEGHPEAAEILKKAGVKPGSALADELVVASEAGQYEMVKALISKGAKVNSPDSHGAMALPTAVLFRQTEIVKLLLDEGADPNGASYDANGSQLGLPLALAASQDDVEIVKLLLAKKANPNSTSFDGTTALAIATKRAQTEIVNVLKSAGAVSGNEKPPQPSELLFMAVSEGKLENVKSLLEHGTNPNVYDSFGSTPLLRSLNNQQREQFESAKLLIAHGADVNDPGKKYDVPPLFFACSYTIPDDASLVILMLEKGAKVNAKGSRGDTPLMGAAHYGNTQIVRVLIEKGADVTVKDNEGNTALSIATKRGHAEIIRLLEAAGAKE